ncbi:RHS repeat domain-containing protein [Facilibium subflavum]|uniref:RHS repeat domain-containing protein n=1 Tax=Facilibium subflavum TaxID=2219058 RepID=UPI0013C37A71|nr:RHS repeat-associated core domain-containing protein [Facilibium subflavum]
MLNFLQYISKKGLVYFLIFLTATHNLAFAQYLGSRTEKKVKIINQLKASSLDSYPTSQLSLNIPIDNTQQMPFSQINNRLSTVTQESVDPASGNFNFLIKLLENTASNHPINLNIYFDVNSYGILGLPDKWKFNIDYITNNSLILNGKSYLIDTNWVNTNAYHSGLKYVNNKGIKFERIFPEKILITPLKSIKTYAYKLRMPNGETEYFDHYGKLICKSDRFHNSIFYDYTSTHQNILNNNIRSITDSLGQIFHFTYSPGKINIHYTDSLEQSHIQSIFFDQNGVRAYQDEMGYSTFIDYGADTQHGLIRNIRYPSGKITYLQYTQLPASFTSTAKKVYAVSQYTVYDEISRKIAHSSTYFYGRDSGRFYTGYPLYSMTNDKDSLYESKNKAFIYDVIIYKDQKHGKGQKSRILYNYAGRPIEVDNYLPETTTQPMLKTTYQYSSSPNNKHQSTYDNGPTTVTRYAYSLDKHCYIKIAQDQFKYDECGNTTSYKHAIYNPVNKSLRIVLKKKAFYDNTFNLNTMTKTFSWDPRKSSYSITTNQNTLDSDKKLILTTTIYYENDKPWKAYQFRYNEQGQVIQQSLKWIKNKSFFGIHSTTQYKAYYYNPSKKLKVIETTTATGKKSSLIIDSMTGLVLKKIVAGKVARTYQYNLTGQLIKITLPNHVSYKTYYRLYQSHGENAVIKTTPMGAKVKINYDALARITAKYQNTDPENNEKLVFQSGQHYNQLGLIDEKIDKFGNKLTFNYNSLGMPIQSLDHDGNQGEILYDFATLSQTVMVNGIKASQSFTDADGKEIAKVFYPNSHNPQKLDYQLAYHKVYDGLGNVLTLTTAKHLKQSSKKLSQTNYMYNPDNKVIAVTFAPNVQDKKTVETYYDLNNNVVFQKKIQTVDRKTTQRKSSIYTYDADANLVQVTDAKGYHVMYRYNQVGKLSNVQHDDGTKIQLFYDDNGNLICSILQKKQQHIYENTYDQDGKLILANLDGQKLTFTYTVNGQLTQVIYPNGRMLQKTYNQYGQRTSITDVYGNSTYYTFQKEKLVRAQLKDQVIKYQYSTKEHPDQNKQLGVIIGKKIGNVYQESYQIDPFNQVIGLIRKDQKNRNILSIKKIFSANGLLTGITSSSDINTKNADINYHTTYEYDDFKRLTKETTTSIEGQLITNKSYKYDVNDNIIEEQNNHDKIVYVYNNDDQLLSYTKNEQKYNLTYDQSGNLLSDGQGTYYQYNDFNQLISLSNQNGVFNYRYTPDGLLASTTHQASPSYDIYYDEMQILSTKSNNQEKSYLLDTDKIYRAVMNSVTNSNLMNWDYYLSDGKNNKILFTKKDNDIEIKSTQNFSAYGESKGTLTDTGYNFAYQAQGTGLVYMQHRFYNPTLKRFITKDSYPTWNKYGFADGNPVMKVDPTGNLAVTATCAIVATVFTALSVSAGMASILTKDQQVSRALSYISDGFAIGAIISSLGENVFEAIAKSAEKAIKSSIRPAIQGLTNAQKSALVFAGMTAATDAALIVSDQRYQTWRGISSLLLSNISLFFHNLSLIHKGSLSILFSSVDDTIQGIAIPILESDKTGYNLMHEIISGAHSGTISGSWGGKFYAKYVKSDNNHWEKQLTGKAKVSQMAKGAGYMALNGMVMEFTRTSILEGSLNFNVNSISNLAYNTVLGGSLSALQFDVPLLVKKDSPVTDQGKLLAMEELFQLGIPFSVM